MQYFDPKMDDGIIQIRNEFLCVRKLKCGNARGLFESFESAMQYSGITDWKTKLVAFSTDGATVNIANGGLKGLLEKEVPWIAFFFGEWHTP